LYAKDELRGLISILTLHKLHRIVKLALHGGLNMQPKDVIQSGICTHASSVAHQASHSFSIVKLIPESTGLGRRPRLIAPTPRSQAAAPGEPLLIV
jgi:hypothetical protein